MTGPTVRNYHSKSIIAEIENKSKNASLHLAERIAEGNIPMSEAERILNATIKSQDKDLAAVAGACLELAKQQVEKLDLVLNKFDTPSGVKPDEYLKSAIFWERPKTTPSRYEHVMAPKEYKTLIRF